MFISSYYPIYLTNAYKNNPNFDEKNMRDAEWYLLSDVLPKIIQACREGKNSVTIYRKDFPSKQMEDEVLRILSYRGFHTYGTFDRTEITWY